MDNKELLTQLGIDVRKIHTSGKTLCPQCSHTRTKKNDPCLSVDVTNGTYNCHNDTCDFHGKVGVPIFEPKAKVYAKPKFVNTTQLSEKTVNYFFKRGISQKTLNKLNVTEGMQYMPQTQNDEKTIQFNYFRNGELVNIKYRDARKNFKMVKDAELIFYNIDSIKDSDWCIITEGEMDALSCIEIGLEPVVSVPNGASRSNNVNLEYLDNCIGYFENKKRIIIATDNDEAGICLRDELARRLGKERCFKVDFGSYKDANSFLEAGLPKDLKSCFIEANLKQYPIDGIITADSIWDDMEDLFQNGLRRGVVTGGLTSFDQKVSFELGQLMVLTGIPNHGKSPFALMIMACLSINHGWKWGIFSPEHKPLKIFMAKVCELLLGKRMRKGVGFTTMEKDLAKEFISNHFFFIEPKDEDYSVDNILLKAKQLVSSRGIKGLIIDPWNKLEHKKEKSEDKTEYISRQLDNVIKFNQKNSVFTIIVAHPAKIKKMFKSTLHEVPSLYDISDSANWYNKPDIGITYYRNFETSKGEVYIQKFKHEHLGETGKVEVRYNMNNGRFVEVGSDWDNTNWLIKNGTQTEIKEEPKKDEMPIFDPNEPTEELTF